jgi:hypothetical protein
MLNAPTIRAIVRFDISEPVPLPAGLVVMTSARICDPDVDVYRFPAIRESKPERVLYLSPKDLLPMSMFLARQPSSDFWFVVHRARWIGGQPDCFLSDPRKADAGPRPFRFESEGEALYYLREYRIGLRNVLIGRMGLNPGGDKVY